MEAVTEDAEANGLILAFREGTLHTTKVAA